MPTNRSTKVINLSDTQPRIISPEVISTNQDDLRKSNHYECVLYPVSSDNFEQSSVYHQPTRRSTEKTITSKIELCSSNEETKSQSPNATYVPHGSDTFTRESATNGHYSIQSGNGITHQQPQPTNQKLSEKKTSRNQSKTTTAVQIQSNSDDAVLESILSEIDQQHQLDGSVTPNKQNSNRSDTTIESEFAKSIQELADLFPDIGPEFGLGDFAEDSIFEDSNYLRRQPSIQQQPQHYSQQPGCSSSSISGSVSENSLPSSSPRSSPRPELPGLSQTHANYQHANQFNSQHDDSFGSNSTSVSPRYYQSQNYSHLETSITTKNSNASGRSKKSYNSKSDQQRQQRSFDSNRQNGHQQELKISNPVATGQNSVLNTTSLLSDGNSISPSSNLSISSTYHASHDTINNHNHITLNSGVAEDRNTSTQTGILTTRSGPETTGYSFEVNENDSNFWDHSMAENFDNGVILQSNENNNCF